LAKHYNWNQIHKAFLKLNIVQIIDYEQGYIYYRDPVGNKIVVKKANNMPKEYVEAVLANVGMTIPFAYFETLYSEEN